MSDVFPLSPSEIKAVVGEHLIKRGEGVLAVTVTNSDLTGTPPWLAGSWKRSGTAHH